MMRWRRLAALVLAAMSAGVAADVVVHFHAGGRFAADTPLVSRWLGPDVAVVATADDAAELVRWRGLSGVRLVEEDAIGHFAALPPVAAPNDPLYAQQAWLSQIDAATLWALGKGQGVTVAVVDSGVDLSHPDLQANLLPGYNYGDGNATPQDQRGHGTVVAGLLGARGGNGIGVSGVAPEVKILPVKINAANAPDFQSSVVAQSIDYAVRQGVQVINLSITISKDTEVVRAAIERALAAGIVVVAAAGNDGSTVAFPANMSGVVAVANVCTTAIKDVCAADGLYANSNRGSEIAVGAPGVTPLTTSLGGGYSTAGSGTSYSSPVVSGVLAILKAANPNLSTAQLLSLLQQTAQPVAGYNFGSLRAGKAATALVPNLLPTLTQARGSDTLGVAFTLPPTGSSVDLYLALTTPVGEFALRPDGSWQAVASDGYVPLLRGYTANAALSGTLFGSGGAFASLPLAGLPGGSYQWRIAMFDSRSSTLLGAVSSATTEITP